MQNLQFHNVSPNILGNSQKGQDSFIQYAFNIFGTTNKYYIEFGAMDGTILSNTSFLRTAQGWNGLLLEGNHQNFQYKDNPDINLHIHKLSKENICELFAKYGAPNEPDFLCIDIDGIDYHLMQSIFEGGYRPRVIMIEVNVRFEPDQSYVLKYDTEWDWDGADWYGGSPYAMKKLANQYDYVPVWTHIDDMIMVRKDVLQEAGFNEPDWSYVYPGSNVHLYDTHRVGSKFVTELNLDKWEEV
tara:strand:- start:47 stop:775 length:729 start_codon:yes stop_codon:yes gene_type:complete